MTSSSILVVLILLRFLTKFFTSGLILLLYIGSLDKSGKLDRFDRGKLWKLGKFCKYCKLFKFKILFRPLLVWNCCCLLLLIFLVWPPLISKLSTSSSGFSFFTKFLRNSLLLNKLSSLILKFKLSVSGVLSLVSSK